MDLANKTFLATIALLLYNVSSHAQATSSTVITNEKQPNDLHLMVIYALIAICIVFVTLLIKSWINTKHLKEKLILTGANIPELAEGKIILETLPIGIAIYNKDGVREYYNSTIANIFKVYDTHIYKGKHSVLFDDPAISNDVKKQILEGEDIDSIFEYDLNKTILKDSLIDKELSHTLFLNIRVRYIKDNNGTIEKYIVIVTDITKRWLYDLQLQRSKQYLNLALEVGGVTVWYYDIKQSHFYNINNEVSLEEGTTLDEIKATLQDRHREIFSETINNLLSQKIKEGEYIHKDKNDNYFKTKIISVFDKDGNLEKLIGSHKDITEYYQQKQTLEENKNTTELAIKTSNLVQWGYDCKTGVFDAVNEVIKTDKPYLVAEDYLRIAHPDDYNLVYSFIKQMQERLDIDFSYDARMRLPGFDKWQYVTIDGKSIKDRDGNIIKYTGFRRNNTKLVELNKQLNMKNIHMNMIFQAGGIIPTIIDIASNTVYILQSNKKIDISQEDLTTSTITITLEKSILNLHPDDREKVKTMFENIKNGIESAEHTELRYDRLGVYDQIYDANYVAIDYDKYGKPHKILGYLQNITSRKKSERNIQQQKDLMTTILNTIPVPISIIDIDNDYKYVYWNDESRKMFGEGIFKSAKDIMEKNTAFKLETIDKQVFETGIPYTSEETITKLDGTEYETIVHKSVIYNNDKKLLLAVRWDIGAKNELHRKSKILSITMSAIKAYSWHCDLRYNIFKYGDEFDKIGVAASNMNSTLTFAQKIHPNHRQGFITFMDNICQQSDTDFSYEYEIDMNSSGQYEWWERRGIIEETIQDGISYKYIYGMDINIDNLKQNELSILKNKAEIDQLYKQNELILNNNNTGLVFLDNSYVVRWENLSTFLPNNPMTKNYRKNIICYKTVKGLDAPCPNCVVEKSYISGKMEHKEICYNGKTGEITANPIFNDSHTRIGTVLKLIDITEKRRIHEELEASKNRAEAANTLLRNIIDCLPCLLIIKDVNDDFRHVMVNKYFSDVIGIPVNEIIGKTDVDLYNNETIINKFHDNDYIAANSNQLYVFEEETSFNGKHIIWQTTKYAITTSEGRKFIITVSLDITRKIDDYNELQKAKEKAEEANRLKSAFLANMSHEIRTPLNAIVGFSELMAEATEQEEKDEFSSIINSNSDLLLQLINDILDLSKIEAGMIELKPAPFDIAELYKDIATMFEKRIKNNVKLIYDNPYKSCIVDFDKNRFMQIITNFMSNAVKFTIKGSIKMSYEYINGGVKIYVSDTGIGIDNSKKDKVFERFEKLNDYIQGTGLGMAICKAIIESSNGEIGVESELGLGSTFWAWIPLKATIIKN